VDELIEDDPLRGDDDALDTIIALPLGDLRASLGLSQFGRGHCKRPSGWLAGHPLGLLLGLLHGADVARGVLWQVVAFAVPDLLEGADRVCQRGVLAVLAGEDLGDEERLRQESLNPSGAVDDELVLL